MEKVIVSRKWKEPEITTFVDVEQVGSSISLDDYLISLTEEIGNPTMIVSKAALLKRLQDASSVVVIELKKTTIHI
jgi:hypothetical protein